MRQLGWILLLLIIIPLIFTACGPANSTPIPANEVATPPEDIASRTVEAYLNALVEKNSAELSTLSCADWEPQALLELDAFQAVSTRLESLTCTTTSTNGDTTQVSCQGKILATYDGEDQEFDLSIRIYQVIRQGGDYLVCGYE